MSARSPVVIVSGCPGAGRSSVSARLAAADPDAVGHIKRAFAAAHGFAEHALETSDVSLDDVLRTLPERRASGAPRLDRSRLARIRHR